ncbi:MAG: hypothetical protein A2Y12_11955 [Planctomycetes bacterium GWF2_42_9]|nr:MAG: hypothetical protein A2Y12_11955 [Planctomycetes bacterium GWF2_42_9]HAL44911.1 hypothetical protein [Phycisphaerales bacterium]
MPVRFNGKKDLIGMFFIFAILPTIALFGTIFMSSNLRWLFLLVILLVMFSLILNRRGRKKHSQ